MDSHPIIVSHYWYHFGFPQEQMASAPVGRRLRRGLLVLLVGELRAAPGTVEPPGIFLWDVDQWPFQEPKLEVPTIYKAYVRSM